MTRRKIGRCIVCDYEYDNCICITHSAHVDVEDFTSRIEAELAYLEQHPSDVQAITRLTFYRRRQAEQDVLRHSRER